MSQFTSASQLLSQARSRITRYRPHAAAEAQATGAFIVDLRCSEDRLAEGTVPHAVVVGLSVLPWRVDPEAERTDPRINDRATRLILMCNDGYSSSLAAATLTEMGFADVGDIDGGFRAWSAAGLPIEDR